MAKRYVFVRMPRNIYDQFVTKKIKMEQDLKELTGKRIPMTMPKVWALVAKNPVEIGFDNLIKSVKGRTKIKLK